MRAMASQVPSVSIAHSNVCFGTAQRKHPSSASLAFVRGIHRLPLNSLHKGSVTRKRFPFDDVIMAWSSMIMASCHGWLDLFAHRLCTGTAALTARKCGPVSVVHDSGHRGKQRKLFSSNHPGAKLQTADSFRRLPFGIDAIQRCMCTSPIPHRAPFCNTKVHTSANIYYGMVNRMLYF